MVDDMKNWAESEAFSCKVNDGGEAWDWIKLELCWNQFEMPISGLSHLSSIRLCYIPRAEPRALACIECSESIC